MLKILKTKETVLDKEQLKKYLANLAADNVIKRNSSSSTYPIPRLKENCEYISLVYTLLNEHLKIGLPIHPAGEWILDNYYIIEKTVKTITKDLSLKKYVKFPGIEESGFARIYVLANEIVSNTDGKITEKDLKEYIEAYQTQKELYMEEFWNIGTFLQISIIEKIRNICEKIFVSQSQKYKVENIVQRLIENKNKKKIDIGVEGKYPFIEYMSYKLKKYGKISNPYLAAFEEQVEKMGMTVSEVINREHYDIAVKTVSMKNCITSIKNISMIDIVEIFKDLNIVEKILSKDPIDVYKKMDYTTKAYYRTAILEISEKTKTSEIFIAEQVIKMCTEEINKKEEKQEYEKDKITLRNEEIRKNKKCHVGYYLIDDGKKELLSNLLNKKINLKTYEGKVKTYIATIYILTSLITICLLKKIGLISILLFIPIQNAVTQIVQYIYSKHVKQKIIPKLDYQGNIPKEEATMCVLPVVLKSAKDVENMTQKMETYYLANKSKNLYFTLLGDCKQSKNQEEKEDDEIENAGIELTKKLNEKYGNIFFFTYRHREWCSCERCYMGWERKRGILNQFNEYLKTGTSKFKVNTIKNLPKIKYVITLDEDTNLTLDSAFKLIGAMGHILNKPEINIIKNTVEKGHAIIQPRVGIDIMEGRKTIFSRLFGANGGTDLYTNAISDVYQDNFDEGIYTGKGIYDLDVFYEVLKDSIPENMVLSHDLLEGSYLRCGLASDILLMDGYPSNYNSYKVRKNRWIRGDIQISSWIKSELNTLSKYKILDNIVRNLNEVFLFLVIFLSIFNKNKVCNITYSLIILGMPTIVKLIDNFINEKQLTTRHILFENYFSKWTHAIYKFFIELMILPDTAFLEINAICKALYRMKISRSFLLEWTTADEAERKNQTNLLCYEKSMCLEKIIALIILIFSIKQSYWLAILISGLWAGSALEMYFIGRTKSTDIKISNSEKEYLQLIGRKTWLYFKENMVNFLPADNYQDDRKIKQALRTSPTNIGLAMISAVASYDLGYEDRESTIELIKNIVETTDNLQKWNGHLYNWYDIQTLKPLFPYDISSVDSGNFVGYLYTVKQFLIKELNNDNKKDEIFNLIKKVNKIINETDFSKLYNPQTGLFSIGFNVSENKLYESYYDLLASEARQTSLISIAKKDVPSKHWSNLGRTLTRLREHKGLVSWGGTAFEYLMPNINIPTYPTTLIDESCKVLILSDKEYAKKLDIPWGISEAAYSLKDFYGNYQYKTFGIPWLGLKRGLADEIVVSPYSTALALPMYPKESIENLKRLEKDGLVGKYGFYDSIDYKPKKEIVKTYMAHHQGMIIASIDNTINNNIFQKRFMNNPEMQGIKILLEENMPENVIITKERKDRVNKIKYDGYEEYPPRTNGLNVLSQNELSNMISENKDGYTKLNDIVLYNEMNIYVKNIENDKIYDINNFAKNIEYTPYSSKISNEDGNIKISVDTTIAPDCQVEIRKIKITNKGLKSLKLEVSTYTEPILSTKQQYESHQTFDKMFIRYKCENGKIIITRKPRMENEPIPYLTTNLFSNEGNMEFEIDKEKIDIRGNKGIPYAIKNSIPFSKKIETVVNPIISMRKIVTLEPGENKELYLLNSAAFSEVQSVQNLEEYMNVEILNRVFELSKAQKEAETRYMAIKEKDIETYQKMIKYLIYPKTKINKELDLSDRNLWKYGISGDFPIILVKIKELNDYYVVKEIFKAYEYFISKNIFTDIIILANVEIENNVVDDKMSKYINQRHGIFIIKNIEPSERRILENRAAITIDAHFGSLSVQMKELSNTIEEKEKNEYDEEGEVSLIAELGKFNEDGTEYWIYENRRNRTPVAWSNIMANEKFGTVITEGMGGYTWYINSKTNRMTKFSNDAFKDNSSEKIYMEDMSKEAIDEDEHKMKDKKIWSIDVNNLPDNNDYKICFGFGYSKFIHASNEIEQELTIYVPKEDSIKVNILKLTNISNDTKKIKIKYILDMLMGERNDKSIINENYKQNLNMILIKNNKNPEYYAYVTSNEKINKNKEIEIEIKQNESKEIIIVLGCEKTELECIDVGTKYTNNAQEELEKTKRYWKEKVSKVCVQTPLQSFNIMQNGWLVYQTMVSRLIAKTGFYQSSGGYGYRDQLQDAIGMKWIDSEILKNQILLHSKHQFIKGDVEHWWHEDSQLGIRTRFSDDLLWLVYAVEEYIDFTGDYSILHEETNYLNGEELKENEKDKVNVYEQSDESGTILEHCIKAIEKSLNFGEHGLPLINGGDWNDGMNKIGESQKGESVWLGFFLYHIMTRFIQFIEDEKEKDKFQETINKLRKILNTTCWDGRWYIRAFDDNGEPIGSMNNEECKIDSIAQSWSVISNAGDNDKKYIAMTSLENNLIDNNNNLVKLLTPALEKEELGYITSYAKGMRENGGQYTHAAIWALIAETMLNKPEEAINIYTKINPIEHTKSREEIQKYKVEPYVIEADIYSENNLAGRGGWTWYTGSSSCLYEAQIRYILGINIYHGIMTVKPCVPKNWEEFNVKFKWKNAVYNLKYKKGDEKEIAINNDQLKIKQNEIELQDSGEFDILITF